MNIARSDHTANVVGDAIIVVGGCIGYEECIPSSQECHCTQITNSVEAYYPINDTWITLPSILNARYRHSASVIEGILYVFGGRDIDDNIITTMDVFSKGSWNPGTAWPEARSDTSAFVINSTIFVVGGYTATYTTPAQMMTYSPVTGLWANSSNLNFGRGDACADVDETNTAYIVGGYAAENFCAPLTSMEIYNPSTGMWTVGPAMQHRRGDAACATNHGEFHVIAGEDKNVNCSLVSDPVSAVESYNVGQQKWVQELNMPETVFRFAAASFPNDNYIYMMGGQSPFTLNTSTGHYVNHLYSTIYRYYGIDDVITSSTTTTSHASDTARPALVLYCTIMIVYTLL